jgi:hypothetical protein
MSRPIDQRVPASLPGPGSGHWVRPRAEMPSSNEREPLVANKPFEQDVPY